MKVVVIDTPGMRAGLLDILSKGIAEIEFTKVDGTLRELDCTLNSGLIPFENIPKAPPDVANNEGWDGKLVESNLTRPYCKVFAPSLKEWRSFRWESLKSYKCSET